MRATAPTTARAPKSAWRAPRFVPLPENRSARVAVKRLAAGIIHPSRGCPFNLLVIHGPPGIGKTLLADSLHEQVAGEFSITRLAAADWPSPDHVDGNDARKSDLLIVEDLQYLPRGTVDGFSALLDDRRGHRRPTLITARTGPAQLNLPGRLRNRLVGGLVIAMETLAPRSRLKFLRALARQRELDFDDAVLIWLAKSVPGSARQLTAAMNKLEASRAVHGRQLDLPDVMERFRDEACKDEFGLDRIAEHVGKEFQVAVRALRGPNRHPQTLWPRQVSMYLARELTGLSLAQIGGYFDRDQSTVRHACEKVAGVKRTDVKLAGLLRRLTAELG